MAGIDQKTLWDFARIVLKGVSDKQQTQSVRAKFLRTDPDGTQWVQLAGSSEETPVNGRTLASAQAGDTVELEISDGVLSLDGNASEPSVGMRSAEKVANEAAEGARRMAADAGMAAELSKQVADAAQQVADAISQHFFADTNGIHVTEATQDDWNADHTGPNVLLNSIGQLFRDGLNNLLTLTTENGARALTIWDGLGSAASNVRAIIGETIQLGKSSDKHLTIDSDSVDLMNGSDVIGTFGSNGVTIGSEHSQDYHNVVDSNGLSIWTKRGQDLTKLLVMRFSRDGITFAEDRKHTISLYNVLHEIVADSSGLHLYAYGDPVLDSPVARIDLQAAAGSTTGNGSIKFTTRVGSNTWSTPAGTVLWSGAGWAMTASHTATLAHNVSTCPTGIVLHWQAYVSGSAANQDQCYCFVPKSHVANFAGGGVQMPLMTSGFGKVGCKYVYIYDNRVVGAANNNQSGTGSSITYDNSYWVLTQIIAV